MAFTVEIEELFVLLVLLVGYVPVIRAYVSRRRAPWLFAGYTALVVGRAATILEDLALAGVLGFVEHAVGVALAGLLFLVHFYTLSRRDDDRPGDDDQQRADDTTPVNP